MLGSACMKNTIINPPSNFHPYLHSRPLAVSHHRFLTPSLLLPPSLPPYILPRPFPVSHHRFLPPSRPLLPPSLPPSILPLSFPAPRCPPASCRATQYTPCVYTVLVSCTVYYVGGPSQAALRSQAWHWDNGVVAPSAGGSVLPWQRTPTKSVFDE